MHAGERREDLKVSPMFGRTTPEYREYSPRAELTEAVECFWSMRHQGGSTFTHRVLADGCADILYMRMPKTTSLMAVGAMTRFEDFDLRPGAFLAGIRFRPGMWPATAWYPRRGNHGSYDAA